MGEHKRKGTDPHRRGGHPEKKGTGGKDFLRIIGPQIQNGAGSRTLGTLQQGAVQEGEKKTTKPSGEKKK